jgi:DNA polymerase elongation subunit (family B)
MQTRELENLLFIDVETARGVETYAELPEGLKYHWGRRTRKLEDPKDVSFANEEERNAWHYEDRAGIFAEFNRVVCISVGYLRWQETHFILRVKSFYGADEAQLLRDFAQVLEKTPDRRLCGHNIKEFDYPVLGRRFLVNRIPLPTLLQGQNRKPWEMPTLDTMDLWKFGDGKNYTALDLLCQLLEVPTPKGDMDGSQVSEVFWKDRNYTRIAVYCEADVAATAGVLLRLVGHEAAFQPLGVVSESGF